MRVVSWASGETGTATTIPDDAMPEEVRQIIQQILDEAEAAASAYNGSAVVTLSAGEFVIDGTGTPSQGGISIGSNVTLRGTIGENGHETIIRLDSAYDTVDVTGIVRTRSEAGVHDVTIKDLVIIGNGATPATGQQVDGIYTGFDPNGLHEPGEAHSNITIANVVVSNVSRYGFDPHEQTVGLTLEDCVAYGNGKDGFVLDFIIGGTVQNNLAYDNGRHGFNLVTGTHSILFANNQAYGNGDLEEGSGLVIQPPSAATDDRSLWPFAITVQGGFFADNTDAGIRVTNGINVVIESVEISGNLSFGIIVNNQERNPGEPSLPLTHGIAILGSLIANNGIDGINGAEIKLDDGVRGILIAGNRLGVISSLDYLSTLDPAELEITGNYYNDGTVDLRSPQPIITYDDPAYVGAMGLAEGSDDDDVLVFDGGRQFIDAGGGDDSAFGGEDADTLLGRAGNDRLDGGAGDDVLLGGDGADTLRGRSGADTSFGGAGNDRMSVDQDDDVVIEYAGQGFDFVYASVNFAIGDNIEYLALTGSGNLEGRGNASDNTILGNDGGNWLSAWPGDDYVAGGKGADTVLGGQGNDTILGGNQNDSLAGNSGDDLITGGWGLDTLSGGGGDDVFIFQRSSQSGAGSAFRDVIADFRTLDGDADRISVSGIDADLGLAGNQAFTWIGGKAFSDAGQLRYLWSGNSTLIQGNTDADTAAEFEILLKGRLVLSVTAFDL
jgi:Ca2+-binding RTX toxin-like protein